MTAPGHALRKATADDAGQIMLALGALLAELRNQPGSVVPVGAEAAFRHTIADPAAGSVWIAEDERRLLGYVALSYQWALRAGGRYAIIQELWVDPAQRSAGIGEALLDAAARGCAEAGLGMIEVGLPGARFAALDRVSRFYQRCGFTEVGLRMRRPVEGVP
jgi:GNAT superfamily N-acetyltransferase